MSGLIPLPDDYYHYAIKTRSSNNQQSNRTIEETQEDENTVLANEENKREEKLKKYIEEEKKWTKELSEQKGSYTLDEPMENRPIEEQIKIMKSNREYLKKLDFNSQVLILPDICVTKCDRRRFTFKDNFLKIVNRIDEKYKQYHTDIKDEIEETQQACFYFTGCKGSGKSHFLYLIASQLMTIDNYTVVYVPLCTDLIRDVLNALYVSCMASKEVESNQRLKEPLNELKKTLDNFKITSYDDQRSCIIDVKKTMNNRLIFVIDQTNEIIRKPEYATKCTFLTSELLTYNIVLSGSANNEDQYIKLDISAKKINETFVFNEDEAMAFIHVRGKSIEDYVNFLPEIIGITGGLPIEINCFLEIEVSSNTSNEINSIKASMDYRFRSYRVDFTQRYNSETLSKWNSQGQDHSIIIENIIDCLTSNPIKDSYIETFDKRIIKIEIKDGKTYLKPITALAYQCIMKAYHSQIQSQHLFSQFNSAMEFSLNAVSRGFYIEYHLILLLKLGLVGFFEVVPMERNGDDEFKQNKSVEIDLKSLDLELFMLAGRKAPQLNQIKIGTNILFVPIDFNYPGYDFVILDGNNKHLYYFNVIIMKKSEKHISTNDTNAKSEELRISIKSWLELFPTDQYKHYDIYVLPKSNLNLYSLKRSSNFVFFEDLAKKNPHLEYISSYFKNNKQVNVKTTPINETASKATTSESNKERQYNDNEKTKPKNPKRKLNSKNQSKGKKQTKE